MNEEELRQLAERDQERRLNGEAATAARLATVTDLLATYANDQPALSQAMTEIDQEIAQLRVEEKALEKVLDPPALYIGLTGPSRKRHREVAERIEELQERFLCHLQAFTALELERRGITE